MELNNLEGLVGAVVQFTEGHKWRGSLGFVSEVKKTADDYKFLIGCTVPDNKTGCATAYIYSMLSEHDFEPLIDGRAVLMPGDGSESGD